MNLSSPGQAPRPLDYDLSTPDFEVTGRRPYRWQMFVGRHLIGEGVAWTRLGLVVAVRLRTAVWRWSYRSVQRKAARR